MFIVSLAIADLIVGLVVMPISTVYIFTKDWLFGVAVCQIWIGVDYTASTASILNLFILSMDRYWSVTSPLKYIRKRTKKRAVLMISGVWVLSSMWIIPIVGWHHFSHGGNRTVAPNVCDTEYAKNSAFKVVTAFFNFYLPLAVMYGLYWKIFQEIRKRSEMELGQRNIKTCNSHVSTLNSVPDEGSYSDQNLESDSQIDNINANTIPAELDLYEVSKHERNHNSKKAKCKKYFVANFLKKPTPQDRNPQKNGSIALKTQVSTVSESCKVEYVYDESVIDEQTEKVERYYYDDYSSLKPTSKPNTVLVRNSSNVSVELSSPSTPLSSCSSNEDRRLKTNDKYSIISGLRRIREAETIIDKSTSGRCKEKTKRNAFVFRDVRPRRPSTKDAFNIKNRIKHIRQSSS